MFSERKDTRSKALLDLRTAQPMAPAVAAMKYEGHFVDAQTLNQFFSDKAFYPKAVQKMAKKHRLGPMLTGMVLRNPYRELSFSIDDIVANNPIREELPPRYFGGGFHNSEVDRAISDSEYFDWVPRRMAGRGATPYFSISDEIKRINTGVGSVPVIVIGAGPAGLMTTRALVNLGFSPNRITVIDENGAYGGIWLNSFAVNGSINNPVPFSFEGAHLPKAPGTGSNMIRFLSRIEDIHLDLFSRRVPQPIHGKVMAVEPADLRHLVRFETSDGERSLIAPIVINAIGNRIPISPETGPMTTDTPEAAGIRDQMRISLAQAERYRGGRLIIIGLGNSTADMLVQVQKLNDIGYNIDYRVITHYPSEAVKHPNRYVETEGRVYRVTRDLSVTNLTRYEGDLEEPMRTYFRALKDKKIIADARHWGAGNGRFTVTTSAGRSKTFDYEEIFTLIGYCNDPEQMQSMGMWVTDQKSGTIATDFDGEVQRPIPQSSDRRSAIYPGYFAIGPVAKTKENPNAVTIPGIMHRLYDLSFTSIVRAHEFEIEMKVKRKEAAAGMVRDVFRR